MEKTDVEVYINSMKQENLKNKTLQRDEWKRKIDFLIACTGYSVGLGNVWRFPYLCYKNGGGAFLIPYFVSVICAGIPYFFLEVTLGQFMSKGGIAAWDICPLFRGIGCASTIVNYLVNVYYTVIMSWTLNYLFHSFTNPLPWASCNNSWNTPMCSNMQQHHPSNQNISIVDSSTEYWERKVLRISDGIEKIGYIQGDLAGYLFLAWIIIFMCIFKGIKSSRYVMYVTALSPYIMMIALLIRTSTLEGASEGMAYYLKPDWSKLGDITAVELKRHIYSIFNSALFQLVHFCIVIVEQVWSDAGTQIFFSYAIGLGALTALGSYNNFHHNSLRDCVAFSVINSFTSMLAGCVIFTTLGYMSHISNIPIKNVAESGPGLTFVIYPKAISTMPWSPVWSTCFFIMIMMLGVDSMFGGVEGFVTSITDYIPFIASNSIYRCLFVAMTCLSSALIGLAMVTNGGMYIFQLFDYYNGSRIILIITFLESVVIGYIYGFKRFANNVKTMYGVSLGHMPLLFWCIISPLFTFIIFVFSVIVSKKLTYARNVLPKPYEFPYWTVVTGWTLASLSILCIPGVMLYEILKASGSLLERIKYLCIPRLTSREVNSDEISTNERNQ